MKRDMSSDREKCLIAQMPCRASARSFIRFLSISMLGCLQALSQPLIRTHPQSQWVDAGTNVTFLVTASGTNQISFHWLFNEVEITGGTNAGLFLTNLQPTHSGNYAAIASDLTGSVTSRVARLEVFSPAVHSFAGITQTADGKVSRLFFIPMAAVRFAPMGRTKRRTSR
ncbi:MAG: immunoglobulin domain-containing protein, partial [Verrucomicrobia bacterium]|nr:immunoglobulin domain-containing protein [Verrucomicrobiota bacterium]